MPGGVGGARSAMIGPYPDAPVVQAGADQPWGVVIVIPNRAARRPSRSTARSRLINQRAPVPWARSRNIWSSGSLQTRPTARDIGAAVSQRCTSASQCANAAATSAPRAAAKPLDSTWANSPRIAVVANQRTCCRTIAADSAAIDGSANNSQSSAALVSSTAIGRSGAGCSVSSCSHFVEAVGSRFKLGMTACRMALSRI